MNKSCYYYENIKLDHGLFDNFIDCVYILTMENSSRKIQYMNQINKYKPHKNIIIQYNKGFKLCNKKLYQDNSLYDLNDAYYHAFIHAKNNNYENIIIFEDDFFFDDTINQEIVNSIGYFINNNNYHIYSLGSLPFVNIPSFYEHRRSIFMACAHSLIYNKSYYDIYIKLYKNNKIKQHDININNNQIIKYGYYKPLCFQLFPKTENQKQWPVLKVTFKLLNLLNLDTNHEPGWKIIYNLNNYVWIFVILIIYMGFIYSLYFSCIFNK
jgi:hypothetical protein